MFSLIITIISIALVVALVAATMYHGGDVLSEGRAEADAAAVVAGAQQISGAATMQLALDAANTDLAGLVTAKYLSSIPSIPGGETTDWTLNTTTKTVSIGTGVLSDAVCDAIAADGNSAYGCVKATGFSFQY